MLEKIIFIFFIIITIFTLAVWLFKKDEYKNKHFYNTEEIIALYSIPRIVIAWSLILIAFFFIKISNLHLIYIFPIVYFVITFLQAKKVKKDDEKKIKKER